LSELRESNERERHRDGGKVVNWGERNSPGKPRNDVQAVLIERGIPGGGGKWLKDLVDDGSKERINKWTICIEEHLKLIEIDFIDTLSVQQGEN
jgi:hypothetical protein